MRMPSIKFTGKTKADLAIAELHAAQLRGQLAEAQSKLHKIRTVVENPAYRDVGVAKTVSVYLNGVR